MVGKIKKNLKKFSSKKKAENLKRFFKCGKGEYGEGDEFIGVKVPDQRKVVKKYWEKTSLKQTEKLLKSKIHEYRLTALLILVEKYQKAVNKKEKEKIVRLYLGNIKFINNWDLVDLSAPKIWGDFILNNPKEKETLYEFIKSGNLWKRRIAVLATFAFIKDGKFRDTFRITKRLLNDKEDLIHKASGWMLREIGKQDRTELEFFLKKHYPKMPRTMLRYAIEKFSKTKRKAYLGGKI